MATLEATGHANFDFDPTTWLVCGRMASLPLSFFLFLFVVFAKRSGRNVRQTWTNKGSKRVVPRREVAFRSLNDVPLNFGGQNPSLNGTFLPERQIKILIT